MAVAEIAGRSLDLFFPTHCGRLRGRSVFIGRETIAPRSPPCAVILWAKAFLSAVAEHFANPWFTDARRRKSDETLIFGRKSFKTYVGNQSATVP
jgi:hypothetical protein